MMSKNSSGINNFFPNSLPEFYFQMGPSRNVYLNYHSPLFNGFSYQHKFFELIYVGEGSVRDVIGDTAVELSTGDICIHNPKIFEPIDNDPVLDDFSCTILQKMIRNTIAVCFPSFALLLEVGRGYFPRSGLSGSAFVL